MGRKKIVFIASIILLCSVILLARQASNSKNINKISFKESTNTKYEIFSGSGKMGDKDGKVLEAEFLFNYGMALDKEKNLLIADSYNNKIRKISKDTVTTLAGYSDKKDNFKLPLGEYIDGDISKAKFDKPRDLAVDGKKNVYISDSGNNVIRKIMNGNIYTFAGTGKKGYKDGNAKEAEFNLPSGIAIDKNGDVYVADILNHVIRKISKKGQVSTLSGIKSKYGGYKDGDLKEAMFNEPSDIVVGNDGAIYIADSGNQRIRKISKGRVTTIAGSENQYIQGTNYIKGGFQDGQKGSAKFNFPKGICLDEKENIYVADTFNHSIRVIKKDGTISTLLGDGKAGVYSEARLNQPTSLIYMDGYLYVSDNKNNIISRLKID
ncbi:hypothetical protein OW763_07380 [Clostridium aestuarii]|uniref:Teneurin NHL domain-containing protein n=1 Tax=Clostridium aestuarii TaxID=338193 RepID=A0ABT4D1J3_9CLOT|nr:hypothetical protein [Clostridium aestuarii]MCY6484175.1 hypothetical protein [Clostridium aestuarii]